MKELDHRRIIFELTQHNVCLEKGIFKEYELDIYINTFTQVNLSLTNEEAMQLKNELLFKMKEE